MLETNIVNPYTSIVISSKWLWCYNQLWCHKPQFGVINYFCDVVSHYDTIKYLRNVRTNYDFIKIVVQNALGSHYQLWLNKALLIKLHLLCHNKLWRQTPLFSCKHLQYHKNGTVISWKILVLSKFMWCKNIIMIS